MKPAAKRVLAYLRQCPDGATTHELLEHCSHKFASRISDLRAEGYVIRATRQRAGSFLYRLISEPASSGSAASGSSPAGLPARPGDESQRPPAAHGRATAAEPDDAPLFELDSARSAVLEDPDDVAA